MKLRINESHGDRIIRIILAAVLGAAAAAGLVGAPLLYVVWLVAAILALTGIVGFCPLYALTGLSTKAAGR